MRNRVFFNGAKVVVATYTEGHRFAELETSHVRWAIPNDGVGKTVAVEICDGGDVEVTVEEVMRV